MIIKFYVTAEKSNAFNIRKCKNVMRAKYIAFRNNKTYDGHKK